jgi:hypothetical protein
MAWRFCEASTEIEERHITEVQPGGHFRQDVPAGPGLPNHPAVQTAERTRRNRMVSPPERTEPAEDSRFTVGLLYDVLQVLEAHGYRASQDSHAYADALVALLKLVRAFEGRPVHPDSPQTLRNSDGGAQ